MFGLGFVGLGLGFGVFFSCLAEVRCFGVGVRCCGLGIDWGSYLWRWVRVFGVLDWGPKEYSGMDWIRVRGFEL